MHYKDLIDMIWYALKALWFRHSSVPITVVILVVDYISELTIQSVYVHHFCVNEMYNIYSESGAADCTQFVWKNEIEIVL